MKQYNCDIDIQCLLTLYKVFLTISHLLEYIEYQKQPMVLLF